MRTFSTSLGAYLRREVTTQCSLWRLALSNNTQLGFTDHDQDLLIEGLVYHASSGLNAGMSEARLGFSSDSGAVQGVLTSDRITSLDISNGVYDSARIDHFRVNWLNTEQIVHVNSGHLGVIRRSGEAFEAEWVGRSSQLEHSTGRVFSSLCDAEFGDERCGVNAANFPEGTICARTFSVCQSTFSNIENFRGFPYLLGDDALQAAPEEGQVFDGGSRYS